VNGGLVQDVEPLVPQEIGARAESRVKQVSRARGTLATACTRNPGSCGCTYAHEGDRKVARSAAGIHTEGDAHVRESARGLSSLTRKGPCRWKASAVRKVVARHGVTAGTDLGVSCPGGSTRRRGVHPKLARERRHGCQRLAASTTMGRTSPPWQRNKAESDAARRSGDHGRRETPAPPATRQVPKPVAPRRAQALWTHREPASTGARSREV